MGRVGVALLVDDLVVAGQFLRPDLLPCDPLRVQHAPLRVRRGVPVVPVGAPVLVVGLVHDMEILAGRVGFVSLVYLERRVDLGQQILRDVVHPQPLHGDQAQPARVQTGFGFHVPPVEQVLHHIRVA